MFLSVSSFAELPISLRYKKPSPSILADGFHTSISLFFRLLSHKLPAQFLDFFVNLLDCQISGISAAGQRMAAAVVALGDGVDHRAFGA